MISYRKKIVIASISLHVVAACGLLIYWLFFEEHKQVQNKGENAQHTADNQAKRNIPDTDKNPYDEYEEGDLKNEQINKILVDSIEVENVNPEKQLEKLDSKFDQLSRTPTKDVEVMANIVAESAGVAVKTSSKPDTEYTAGVEIDMQSIKLQDFELTEKGKYILIYKDKNNVFIKDGPHKYEDIDEALRVRLDIVQKAKENKKMRILLNVTDSIMDSLFSVQENETRDDSSAKK